MKFSGFKELKAGPKSVEDIGKYLSSDLSFSLRELRSGLDKLNFKDNMQSFEATVTIGAGLEAAISNKMPNNEIPLHRIITRIKGNASIVDGDTTWSHNFVYLKNTGASSATLTVIFFR